MKHIFLASDISIPVATRLAKAQLHLSSEIEKDGGKFRSNDVELLNITYKNFGTIHEERIRLVRDALSEMVKPLFPFEVTIENIDAFPSLERASIVWAQLDARGRDVIELLQKTVEKEMSAIGFEPEERQFQPQVTLGRVEAMEQQNLSRYAEDTLKFGRSSVRDIALYSCEQSPSGPVYSVIDRFVLGAI